MFFRAKKNNSCALAVPNGQQSEASQASSSKEDRPKSDLGKTASPSLSSFGSRLPDARAEPKNAASAALEAEVEDKQSSRLGLEVSGVEDSESLPSVTRSAPATVNVEEHHQKCNLEPRIADSIHAASVKYESSSQDCQQTKVSNDGTNEQPDVPQNEDDLQHSPSTTRSDTRVHIQASELASKRADSPVGGTPLTTAYGQKVIAKWKQPSNEMATGGLSEMYMSCIPPQPATIEQSSASSQSTDQPRHRSQSIDYNVHPSDLQDFQNTSRAQQSSNSRSGPAAKALRQFFTRTIRGSHSKDIRKRGPNGEYLHISRPYPCASMDLLQSVQKYEDSVDEGGPPLPVLSTNNPWSITPDPAHVEALPRTSTQLSLQDSTKRGNGRRAATWSMIKTLTSKVPLQPAKAFGSRSSGDTDSSPACTVKQQLLDAQARRQEIYNAHNGTDNILNASIRTDSTATPPRPARPKPLYSSSKLDTQLRFEEGGIWHPWTKWASESSTGDENEDEDARKLKHRQRAYRVLDGQILGHRGRILSPIPASPDGGIQSPSRSSSIVSRTVKPTKPTKPLKRISEREMLTLHQSETGTRPESPTLPADYCSEDHPFRSISRSNRRNRRPVSPPRLPLELPIVSRHTSTQAWWEDSAERSTSDQDNKDSISESGIERSKSPPLKLLGRDVKGKGKRTSSSSGESDSLPKPQRRDVKGKGNRISTSSGEISIPLRRQGQDVKSRAKPSRPASKETSPQTSGSASPIPLSDATEGSRRQSQQPKIREGKTYSPQSIKSSQKSSQSTSPARPTHSDRNRSHALAPSARKPGVIDKDHARHAPHGDPSLPDSAPSSAGDQNEGFHVSSSDESLEAQATALRHGKALKGLNVYEAAHAIERVPSAMLSQVSLGLTEQQKNALKPLPLHYPDSFHRVTMQTARAAMTEVRRLQNLIEAAWEREAPNLYIPQMDPGLHQAQEASSPPPVPPRSVHRIRPDDEITTDESLLDFVRPLSTIPEESTYMTSNGAPTPNRPITQPVDSSTDHEPSLVANESTLSSIGHDDHWWSDDEPKNHAEDAQPASSKDTTPEKEGAWQDNDATQDNRSSAVAKASGETNDNATKDKGKGKGKARADADDDDQHNGKDVDDIIQQYRLEKEERDRKRDPRERLRREMARKAVADQEARIIREAQEQQRRAAEAFAEAQNRIERERVERIRNVMRGLRGGGGEEDSF